MAALAATRMLSTALKPSVSAQSVFLPPLDGPVASTELATTGDPDSEYFHCGRKVPASLSSPPPSLPLPPLSRPGNLRAVRGHDILSSARLRRNKRINARLIDAELRNPEKSPVAAISARARDIKNRLRVKSHDERTCSPSR